MQNMTCHLHNSLNTRKFPSSVEPFPSSAGIASTPNENFSEVAMDRKQIQKASQKEKWLGHRNSQVPTTSGVVTASPGDSALQHSKHGQSPGQPAHPVIQGPWAQHRRLGRYQVLHPPGLQLYTVEKRHVLQRGNPQTYMHDDSPPPPFFPFFFFLMRKWN